MEGYQCDQPQAGRGASVCPCSPGALREKRSECVFLGHKCYHATNTLKHFLGQQIFCSKMQILHLQDKSRSSEKQPSLYFLLRYVKCIKTPLPLCKWLIQEEILTKWWEACWPDCLHVVDTQPMSAPLPPSLDRTGGTWVTLLLLEFQMDLLIGK